MFEIRQIIQHLRMCESIRQVARVKRVGRPMVKKVHEVAVKQGWLDPQIQIPADAILATFFNMPRKAAQNLSTVEPFRDAVLQWHAQGINTVTIRRALHETQGYNGSVDALYRFIRREVADLPVATMKLDFAVGEMAQVDFGAGPLITDRVSGECFKTWIFVCTLAWSRHQYAEIVRNQSIETWLACHRHAFEWFNGVPKKIRIDNLKAAITKACYYEPTVQRSYAELALGYAFMIDPCPVADPKKKGRVESGVKYVKNNFVPLREFHSVAHANELLQIWIMGEAGNRIHGSTRQRPLSLFSETEQVLLQALPATAPECASWRKATLHPNCHVQFEYCFYSAPSRLIGHILWLEITPHMLRIYREHELVAMHPRLFQQGEKSTVEDHIPPDAQAYLMRNPQWCLAQARSIGPACLALVEVLFSSRMLDNLRAVQGVIRLCDQYGRHRLESACARALAFGAPQFKTVKQILKQGIDQAPDVIEAAELEAPYLGSGRFSRNTNDLLH
jgi:hypothetical protein